MKCTYDEAVKGLIVLIGLKRNKVDGSIAKIFFSLRRKLQEAVDFENEQETLFVEEHGGKIDENTGKVSFDTPDLLMAFLEKQKEIRALEFEYDAPGKYVLDPAQCGTICDDDMETLTPFIDWKE